jgi:integrase
MAKRAQGTGSLYLRGGVWHCQICRNGIRLVRESTGETNKRLAQNYLNQKLAELNAGIHRKRSQEKLVSDIVKDKLAHDRITGRKDVKSQEGRWKNRLKPFFKSYKACEIETPLIVRYIRQRQAEEHRGRPAPPATINRELALLRASLHYARKCGLLDRVPYFPMLDESQNVRTGFLQPDEYERLADATAKQGLWLRTMFEVAWAFGWRRSEILQRKVKDVDFLGGPKGQGTISLPDSKSGDPRLVTLPKRLRDLFIECAKGKGPEEFLITRDGKPVVEYREAWADALKEAKIERHLLLHDMRRTAVRRMDDAHVPRRVQMAITGHKTESMYLRYNIVDLSRVSEATDILDADQGNGSQAHKVATNGQSASTQENDALDETLQNQANARWAHQDSNLGPTDYESAALTD